MHHESFFFQAFIYLLAAVVAVPVAGKLGLGSVLGYLLAGAIIGPSMLGLVGTESGSVMQFAEFGVVMMLFLVGLEIRPSLLWRLRVPILGLGGLQVVMTAVAVGAILLFFIPGSQAFAIGVIVALSSTAIVLQSFSERGLMKTEAGERGFSILLFQDIAVIPILALLPLLAMQQPSETPNASEITSTHQQREQVSIHEPLAPDAEDHGARSSQQQVHGSDHAAGHGASVLPQLSAPAKALSTILIIAAIVFLGRFAAARLFAIIAETAMRELFTATALLLVIAIALSMQMVGLSPALGTFIAGVVLADNDYRHELEADIAPFKGLLLGLFFIAVGAGIDFSMIGAYPLVITGAVLGLVVVKFGVVLALAIAFKMSRPQAFLLAFALAQAGEFGFVLTSFATGAQVLPPQLAGFVNVVVALSMAVAPILMIAGVFVCKQVVQALPQKESSEIPQARGQKVLIAGYGRFGQIAGRLLRSFGIEPTTLDLDPAQIEALKRFGHKVFYGNAARDDLLQAAGAAEASVLLVAVDDREAAVQIVQTARKHFPHLRVIARSIDRMHTYELMKAGAEKVIRETFFSAIEMGKICLEMLELHPFYARRLSRMFQGEDERHLVENFKNWGDEKVYIANARKQAEQLQELMQSEEEMKPLSLQDHAWDISALRDSLQRKSES